MGLTREIGEFLAAPPLPPAAAWNTVRIGFTDCLGVMTAGWEEAAPALLRRELLGSSQMFWPELLDRASAPDAGLLLGAAAHVLDFDDTGLDGHPSAILLPAILAEGHAMGAGGSDMATAFLAGYEVWAELVSREPASHHSKGWHPSAVFGPLAAAAASAVLRRLDAAQATRAMSLAASMAGGVVANFGSMSKCYQTGRAVQSGLLATRLSEAGLTAAVDALEHPLGLLRALSPREGVDLEGPAAMGTRWRILERGINVKLYPVCYAAHRMLDAMDRIRRTHSLMADDVVEVVVEVGPSQAAMLREHRPTNATQAKFSAEFALASMALTGRCGLAELSDAIVTRSDVQAFMPKVRVEVVQGVSMVEPTMSRADRVTVSFRDGRVVDSGWIELPRGHFLKQATAADLHEKFVACVTPRFGAVEAERQFSATREGERLPDLDTLAPRADQLRRAV